MSTYTIPLLNIPCTLLDVWEGLSFIRSLGPQIPFCLFSQVSFTEFEEIDLNAPEEPRVRGELNWAEYLLVSDVLALYSEMDAQNDDNVETHLAQPEPTSQGWRSYLSRLSLINGSKRSEESKISHI